MRIAICDDEPGYRRILHEMMLRDSIRCDYDAEVTEYESGKVLLEAIGKGVSADVFFLDIQMEHGDDGIRTGRELRRQGERGLIVYVTGFIDYVQTGYEVKAFRYLLKSQIEDKLPGVLADIRQELSGRRYCFQAGGGTVYVDKRRILYLESRVRILQLVTTEGEYRFYDSLDHAQKELGEQFLRCHRSFLVNTRRTLAFSMGVIFALSPWIGLGVLLVGIPMLLMGYYAAGRHMTVKEESADARRRMGDLKSLLTNKHAMYEMKLFRSEELLRKKWEECSRKYADIATRENRKEMAVDMGSRLLNVVYLIFVVCMAAVGLLGGSLTLGAFTAALNGVAAIKTDLNDSGRHVVWMLENAMEIGYYMDFLKLETRADAGSVRTLPHYDIAFENVSFRYPGTERDVLKNVTFYVKEGERIAFVGENGAGKSTLIKLLCGLYEPTTGNVTIGGVPVRDIASDVRPGLISVVFQNFQSYQLSLRENVAFGNLKAISDDRRILEALRLADAEELADAEGAARTGKLKDAEGAASAGRPAEAEELANADGAGDSPGQPGNTGLDRSLGKLTEDGQDLSRGQWQRVAMARAFLSDARYVILDEPVASLDPLAESHMYENFARIFRQRGTILISHRLASAKMADRILVLDGGRIVQTGNHEELMGRQGLYRTMFLAQSSFYRDSEEAGRNKRGNEGSAFSGFQPEI